MRVTHLKLLVEEPSSEAFLAAILPTLLPEGCSFSIHAFQGKRDMLANLEARLRSYARWLPEDHRVVILLDRDRDDCLGLKRRMEDMATRAGLISRTRAEGGPWQVVNRVAVEELEAWYFGDWQAVREAFPRVPPSLPNRSRYRDPDAILGGTWEALLRVLQTSGYFETGLRKVELARAVGGHFSVSRCRSRSFRVFLSAVEEAIA